MSQLANITVFDGAATPVSHTLVGEQIEKLSDGTILARWKESLTGVPDYAQVRASMSKRKLPSGIFRTSIRLEVPVMEAVAGNNAAGYTAPPKVAYVNTVDIVGYFHERSLIAERRLVRQLALNVAGNISTSVAAATTGFAPELVDQLLTPT